MRATARERAATAWAFARAARRYWVSVYPYACRELRGWRRRAAAIPARSLRQQALAAHHAKHGNPEGAAAFATLVRGGRRRPAVRALVAFQAMYDYLDLVSEQESPVPGANGRQLHNALVVALDPGAAHLDYYALNARRDDGRYLEELVDTCRAACCSLPSYATVAQSARRLAARIPEYQHLNSIAPRSHEAFARWARQEAPPVAPLEWWEFAAAAGSSLAVHALLAAAADPDLSPRDATAIEIAYSTWIGALHTLLDSLVDQREDELGGHHSFVSHYNSHQEAAERLGVIASRALHVARELPAGEYHATILAGMVSYYLSSPEALRPRAQEATRNVLAAMGGRARLALFILRTRRRAAGLPWRSVPGQHACSFREDSGRGIDRSPEVSDPPAGRGHVSS
jgi:tetraprenyl-beta-curcumene synthase